MTMVSVVAWGLLGLFCNSPSCGMHRSTDERSFESHEICEEVIEKFHGKAIGKDGAGIQIRFADTENQKLLKASTTERRLHKAIEYNEAAYGPSSPFQYSPTGTNFSTPLQPRIQGTHGSWLNPSPISPM